jgi:hypothetical protein
VEREFSIPGRVVGGAITAGVAAAALYCGVEVLHEAHEPQNMRVDAYVNSEPHRVPSRGLETGAVAMILVGVASAGGTAFIARGGRRRRTEEETEEA